MWHHYQAGNGRPIILLHGIGMSQIAWKPVLPLLSRERRVIAFDTAGFGLTPPLPPGTLPTIPNLVAGLAASLRGLGIDGPVDIVGNSLGGYMALEAAKVGLARSVVAISHAGLWRGHGSLSLKYLFGSMRMATRFFPALTQSSMLIPPLRELFLAVPLSTGSWRMPSEDAIAVAADFGRAKGFRATVENVVPFTGGQNISVPITVAFGRSDWLLGASARHREELPAHTRWLQPKGWGHVPMWKDPEGVARLILEGSA